MTSLPDVIEFRCQRCGRCCKWGGPSLSATKNDIKRWRKEGRKGIDKTIEFAYKTVPYYHKVFDKTGIKPQDIKDVDDLEKIPILTKDVIRKNKVDLISRARNIVSVRLTSGTTGSRLPIYVSREERLARELWARLMSKTMKKDERKRVVLNIVFRRGMVSTAFPMPFLMITIPYILDDPNRLIFLLDELFRKHPLGGEEEKVSVLVLPLPWIIKNITYDLKSRNIDPGKLGIELVLCSGGHITQALRKFVEKKWKAKLIGGYSMAEVCGNAVECYLNPSIYHFDISMIPEVLDIHSKERLSHNQEGALVLTTLYPFQQAMPLIRYWTNDTAELSNEPCECGFWGYSIKKFIGRAEYCIDISNILPFVKKRRIFSYVDVLEVLDNIPELDSRKLRIENIQFDDKSITIKISVELVRHIDLERSNQIVEEIQYGLQEAYKEWNELFREGKIKFHIELLPPFYVMRTRGGYFYI